jgi:hypothetical protein
VEGHVPSAPRPLYCLKLLEEMQNQPNLIAPHAHHLKDVGCAPAYPVYGKAELQPDGRAFVFL